MLSDAFKETMLNFVKDKYLVPLTLEKDLSDIEYMKTFNRDRCSLDIILEPNTDINKTNDKVSITIRFERLTNNKT